MKLQQAAPYFIAIATLLAAATPALQAQGYPRIDPAVQRVTDERKAAANELSDKNFALALPGIEAWAAKGKPYIPNAGEQTYHIFDTNTFPEILAWTNRPKSNLAGTVHEELPQAPIPAFPGAEGGGKYSFGGRGGKVLVVTNLNDSGPGSFREACETPGPRIVIFNVAGIIQLKNRIRVRAPYITIAGNTAPGDGVCIAGDTVELETHDIVIRYMRFRRGETDATDRNDSFGGNPIGNLIIDHVSASWGLDENMSMYRHMQNPRNGDKDLKLPTVNVTIQHSIFSEALNTYHHAFGSTIGGINSTFHHNLWACNTGRNPSVGMYGDFTFANNILYNYAHRSVDGGDHRSFFNIINNYFKPGPGTPDKPIAYRLLKPESERSKTVVDNFGKAYVSGNIVHGNKRVTQNNWDGGVQPKPLGSLEAALRHVKVDRPFEHAPITIQSAQDAYETVLAGVGATLPRRDRVDQRVIEMVRTGTVGKATMHPSTPAKVRAVGYKKEVLDEQKILVTKGFLTHPDEVGGYPKYEGTPYTDTDKDGLPDEWETKHGLDPKNPADATTDLNGDGYTNIEEFINGRDPAAAKAP